ncbi:universal stress protein [Streptomyces sp. V3I7]|uniref:universal stress protein n=1 Tax=Streptomyces sp. V3I7 TaxID=3042278 RepID=UPI00278664D7|nr:universal stress protein [Streptomyces sp. V3I7]MDQ0989685.1 nucleotide-binding universal stress UspA family protein [Streptomyces sp. V3I7]
MSGYDASPTPRVVVGVSGSLGSVTALRRATAEARRRGAELWPVLAWEPPGGELATQRSPACSLVAEEWQRLARARLISALDDVFGETCPHLPLCALVVRGTPGRSLVAIASRDDDVLVVGTGQRGWRRAFSGRVARYCVAHASCPVLAVPPSPLESDLTAVHRRNAWHRRLDTRELLEGDARWRRLHEG